ncbi:MAG TPA: hypothetical protein DCK95_12225 [Anaerolineaceae bacterium]|nr:hypothetical protein [Anaerolineaceae bacterium]
MDNFVTILLYTLLLAFLLYIALNHSRGVLISNGQRRKYLLHVPHTYDPSHPTALVISLHGFKDWPARQKRKSGWNKLSDEEGFIVVYPKGQGIPFVWQMFKNEKEMVPSMENVTFIADLIDHLSTKYNIDAERVYINGFSNGGGMTYMLGCLLSDRIAAIGSVSGAYLFLPERCKAVRPVPMIAFHGTGDKVVPYQGGTTNRSKYSFPSIPDLIAEVATKNGCERNPTVVQVQPGISMSLYANNHDRNNVVLYTLENWRHAWPNGTKKKNSITRQSQNEFSTTKIMWDFFKQHSLY